MSKLIMVMLGGALGSGSRYLLASWVQKIANNPFFPYGTLAVNLIGCLLIGFLTSLATTKGYFTPQTRRFILVGFLGGFTTFSTFSNETFSLITDTQYITASLNIIVSVFLGLAGVWIGNILSNAL